MISASGSVDAPRPDCPRTGLETQRGEAVPVDIANLLLVSAIIVVGFLAAVAFYESLRTLVVAAVAAGAGVGLFHRRGGQVHHRVERPLLRAGGTDHLWSRCCCSP